MRVDQLFFKLELFKQLNQENEPRHGQLLGLIDNQRKTKQNSFKGRHLSIDSPAIHTCPLPWQSMATQSFLFFRKKKQVHQKQPERFAQQKSVWYETSDHRWRY